MRLPGFMQNMGHEILGYVLNLPPEDAKQVLAGKATLDSSRERVLSTYTELMRKLRSLSLEQGDVDFALRHHLAGMIDHGRHVFSMLRETTGGRMPEPKTNDELVRALCRLALECYPLLLLRRDPHSHGYLHHFGADTLLSHLSWNDKGLFKLILEDEDLRNLFPKPGKTAMDTHAHVSSNCGRGGGLQLSQFPSLIVAKAYELAMMSGTLSEEAVVECVGRVVSMLRSLAQGCSIRVPLAMGFENAAIPAQMAVETLLGTWRSLHQYQGLLARTGYAPEAFQRNKPGFVLEMTHDYRAHIDASDRRDLDMRMIPNELGHVWTAAERVSLTLALAIPRDPPVGVRSIWMMVFDPLCQGCNLQWWVSGGRPSVPPYEVTQGDFDHILDWSATVTKTDYRPIAIAVSRLLSALSSRANPVDGILDTVISWENLFSAGSGELSFRISSAIACLLADSPQKRVSIQKDVRGLYECRSKIVHGDPWPKRSPPPQEQLHRCLGITAECLRRLCRDRPDLLKEKDRAIQLILGQAQP